MEPRPFPLPASGQRQEWPRDWRAWSPAQKLEYLLGMTLDDMHDILAWSPNELDAYRLGARASGAHHPEVGVKAGLHEKADRERDRQRTLARVDAALRARSRLPSAEPDAAAPAPRSGRTGERDGGG
jgi:hypothetical protein